MKNFIFLFFVLGLFSCGKNGVNGTNGLDGASISGLNAESTGVDFADILPGLACANGGISIYTFHDSNSDGSLDNDESIIKVKALCNGINGLNGSNGSDGANGVNGSNGTNGTNGTNGINASITLESVLSSSTCPNGGVRFTSGSSAPVEVCNGINGLNGEQGLTGMQGIPGVAGSNGTNGTNGTDGVDGTNGTNGTNGTDGTMVTPVKFCSSDSSTFPEYGLMIGNDLYAVYWGSTPASPHHKQAFLTKLVAGNYQSTGGNNCLFTIH